MAVWKSAPVSSASAKFTIAVQDAFEGSRLREALGPQACAVLRSGSGTLFFSPGAAKVGELFEAVESGQPDGGDLVLLAGEESAMKELFPGWPYRTTA